MEFTKKLPLVFGSLSLAVFGYLYYVKRCYNYLKSFGYDGPPPKFLLGNLTDFLSAENSARKKRPISHYSKTLRRWTNLYGKIYGYYEGHSPVLVLADADLVGEVFLNQNKLLSFRRSFPMSKKSSDPNADIFVSNGVKWLRMRYGLEKVMLNNKNIARCLEYASESFANTFLNFFDKNKTVTRSKFDISNQVKLYMIQSMFLVVFGCDLNGFIGQEPRFRLESSRLRETKQQNSDLYNTQVVSEKFHEAFVDYETFSLLKFLALTLPEFDFVWRFVDDAKKLISTHFYAFKYLADPMDWFYSIFIQKYLILYTRKNVSNESSRGAFRGGSRLQSQSTQITGTRFGYFNSFLYLTFNTIMKYHQHESPYRRISILKDASTTRSLIRPRAFTNVNGKDWTKRREEPSNRPKFNYDSENRRHSLDSEHLRLSGDGASSRQRNFSTEKWLYNQDRPKYKHSINHVTLLTEIETDDFENWKLSINEAISNSLLMFFAGYETTSSAIAFCCKILSILPKQREKLLDEMRENSKELNFNMEKYRINSLVKYEKSISEEKDRVEEEAVSSSEESQSIDNDDDDDDVFEENNNHCSRNFSSPESTKNKTRRQSTKPSALDSCLDLYESIEKLKYLDMFVREVLRMFPIANSMVSRKCVVDDLRIDSGNYYIPKGMNIVVDVLSIHYDPVLWGPVDPELFYPERFLTERNPAAWLPFGIGCRKCLGAKLALSQIKLFIVRLLQHFSIDCPAGKNVEQSEKVFDSIETKDILFMGPMDGVEVKIEAI